MKAPFPYFGGKARIAAEVWWRFGNVANFVEPFFGSGAVLLSRPHEAQLESVNDADCYLANFWRALQNEPDCVAHWADYPVSELDIHARHRYLVTSEAGTAFRERMRTDPDFYDAKFAGWWVWGISCWIGSGWCSRTGAEVEKLPHLSDAGRGPHRISLHQKRPHLTNQGKGVHRVSLKEQIPALESAGMGINRTGISGLSDYLSTLSERLRRVRVCCGDWARVLGPSVTTKNGLTGVFLDPPYSAEANRDANLYASDSLLVAHDAREWAIANGDDPMLRVALCGYVDEHEAHMPADWERLNWKAQGGYGTQSSDGQGRKNSKRECIWFSPHCLKPSLDLFSEDDEPTP